MLERQRWGTDSHDQLSVLATSARRPRRCGHSFDPSTARNLSAQRLDRLGHGPAGLDQNEPATSFTLFHAETTRPVTSLFHDGVLCAGGNPDPPCAAGRRVGGQASFPNPMGGQTRITRSQARTRVTIGPAARCGLLRGHWFRHRLDDLLPAGHGQTSATGWYDPPG
jgi:hypothetical protein